MCCSPKISLLSAVYTKVRGHLLFGEGASLLSTCQWMTRGQLLVKRESTLAQLWIRVSCRRQASPGQLALCLCPGLSWRVPTGQRVVALGVAGDLRPNTKADVSATHLRQADCALAAVRFVGLAGLAFANFYEWPRQVAVPLERVHRQVEVDVKSKWGFFRHDRAPAAWPSAATVNGRNCIL